ncbi:MAG: helix-turn-helix domain-containing protein [Kiloniellales bacterium]
MATNLRRWRRLNGIKQEALAADLGVSQATLSRWEAGTHCPDAAMRRRLEGLLSAVPQSGADRALLRLIRSSATPCHLVCDLTHCLLVASVARERQWMVSENDLLGSSMWRFATMEIEAFEPRLPELGWFDAIPSDLSFRTGPAAFAELTIETGYLNYARFQLSGGAYARLVSDLDPL